MPVPHELDPEAAIRLTPGLSVRSVSLGMLGTLASIFMLRWPAPVRVAMILALTAKHALAPPVSRMQRWGLPRAPGAGWVLTALVAALDVSAYRRRGASPSSSGA